MLYYYLKIMHIVSATGWMTSIVYSYSLWRHLRESDTVAQRIQLQTMIVIIPLALFQLVTGFTMVSIKHDALSPFWIKSSVVSFIIVISSWLLFMYYLYTPSRRLQTISILCCAVALFSMIFFMANTV